MKFIDLFAGIGGFRKGMEEHGHTCVLSCEIDNNARKSYAAIHNEENNFPNDVTKLLTNSTIPKYDVLCAGFPCQPFSRAGSREGFNNDRNGNLFFSVMDIIDETNPKIVFLENVKGLLTSGVITNPGEKTKNGITPKYVETEKGLTFKIILEYLNNHGYDAQWQLINSAHFIAHKRERVYIIATKRKKSLKQIFPIHGDTSEIKFSDKLFENMLANEQYDLIKKESYQFKLDKDSKLIDMTTNKEFSFSNATPWKNFGIMLNGNIFTAKVKHEPEKIFKLEDMLVNDKDVDIKHILSKEEEEKQRYAKSPKTWKSGNKMGRMSFPDKIDKPSRTLTANSSGREMMVLAYKDKFRKLTAKEYFRLQGFTDIDYDKAINAGVSESQIKRQAGNAVTATTIKAIVARF